MKKQLFLLLAFVMTGAVAMAQNAGVWMVGGTFGISTSKTSYTHENVTQVREKQTDFNIIPSLHYFVTDEIAVGAGIGYEFSKALTDVEDDLYNRTGLMVFRPSMYYYVKLSDKFYYNPELYIGLKFGNAKSEVDKNTTYKMGYNRFGIGVNVLNFEFRPTDHVGLGITCGNISYVNDKMKDVPTGAVKYDIKTSEFRFRLQDSFAFTFRYLF